MPSRRLTSYLVLAGLALACAACGGRAPTPDDSGSARAPSDATATSTAPDAAPGRVEDLPALARDLKALAEKRRGELATEQAARASRGADLFALGPCTAPDAAQRAALDQRIGAWIAKALRGPVDLDSAPHIHYGCMDPAGIIAEVQLDAVESDPPETRGYWWILEVGADSIRGLAELSGTATSMWTEWSPVASLDVVALLDLDHDGVRDLVLREDEADGGASPVTMTFRALRGASDMTVGQCVGASEPARLQPPSSESVLVVALTPNGAADGERYYRCIDAAADWSECPSATLARRFDEAQAAADELLAAADALAGDQDHLAEVLARLDIAAEDAAALVARAHPSDAAQTVASLVRTREREARRVDPDLRTIDADERASKAAAAVLGALGDSACAALDGPARAGAEAAIGRFIAGHEALTLAAQPSCAGKGSCPLPKLAPPSLALTCAGASGALVYAAWEDRFAAGEPGERGFARGTLFFVPASSAAGAEPTVVIDRVEALADDDQGRLAGPAGGVLAIKASLHDGHPTALVATADGQLSAVVDGAVTGHGAPAELRWRWADARGSAPMRDDPLARSQTATDVTFWRATPQGVVAAATFPTPTLGAAPVVADGALHRLLVESERRLQALARLAAFDGPGPDLSSDAARAELLQALALTDTEPAALDKLRARLAR